MKRKTKFYTDSQGRVRYMGSSKQKRSTVHIETAPMTAPRRKKSGSFITNEEGRVIFIGGPNAGGGGVSNYSSEPPSMSEEEFDRIAESMYERDEEEDMAVISASVDDFMNQRDVSYYEDEEKEFLNDMLYQWAQDSNSHYGLVAQLAAKGALGASLSEYTSGKLDALGIKEPYELAVEYLKYAHNRQNRPMTLYRGHTGQQSRNALESWTSDRDIAEYFAKINGGNVETRTFVPNDILGTYRDGIDEIPIPSRYIRNI